MITTTQQEKPSTMTLSDWFRGNDVGATSSYTLPLVLLMDGGVSTHLETLIAPHSFSHRELWSSSLLLTKQGRDIIRKGHLDWLNAGSDIITTVTYQCHYGLVDHTACVVSEEKMTEMMQSGVQLAKQAVEQVSCNDPDRDGKKFVVASTGPYGAAMADGSEYTGKYPPAVTEETLTEFHRIKAQTLWDCQPDGLAVETIPNSKEVRIVGQVLRQLAETSPFKTCCWISLACRNGYELNDGSSLQDALDTIREVDPEHKWISAVGVNCCDSSNIDSLVNILVRDAIAFDAKGSSKCPRGIVIYPNSGEAWDAANEEWKDGTGSDDREFANRLMDSLKLVRETWKRHTEDSGSSSCMPTVVLGGCCRTSERTISALRKRIDGRESTS